MEGIGAEVSQKIRSAIKAKLMEIGVYVDEELPDYVMVMVANKRSREQMNDDLLLFLGKHTSLFTTWLHQVLQKLQEVTVANLGGIKRKLPDDSKKKKKTKADIEEKLLKKRVKVEPVDDSNKQLEKLTESKPFSKLNNNDVESTSSSTNIETKENQTKDPLQMPLEVSSISQNCREGELNNDESNEDSRQFEQSPKDTSNKSAADVPDEGIDLDDADYINIRTDGELLDTAEEPNVEEVQKKISTNDILHNFKKNKRSEVKHNSELDSKSPSRSREKSKETVHRENNKRSEIKHNSDSDPQSPSRSREKSKDTVHRHKNKRSEMKHNADSDSQSPSRSREKSKDTIHRDKSKRSEMKHNSDSDSQSPSRSREKSKDTVYRERRDTKKRHSSSRSTPPNDIGKVVDARELLNRKKAAKKAESDSKTHSQTIKCRSPSPTRKRKADYKEKSERNERDDRSKRVDYGRDREPNVHFRDDTRDSYSSSRRNGRSHRTENIWEKRRSDRRDIDGDWRLSKASKVADKSTNNREDDMKESRGEVEEPRKRVGLMSRVVPRAPEPEEDVDTPILSVVKVTPRPRRPPSQQPSSTLIMKAIKEANRSLASVPARPMSPRPDSTQRARNKPEFKGKLSRIPPEKIAISISNPRALQNAKVETTSNEDNIKDFLPEHDDQEIEQKSSKSSSSPKVIHDPEPDKNDISDYEWTKEGEEELEEIHQTQESAHSSSVLELNSSGTIEVCDEPMEEIADPQFVVTLNGYDPDNLYSHSEIDTIEDGDGDDWLKESTDEKPVLTSTPENKSPTPSLHKTKSPITQSNLIDVELLKVKSTERCKYWPACLLAEKCTFYHPTKPCKMFPACKFGDSCLYIHPQCKFNALCTRKDCVFSHTPAHTPHQPSAVAMPLYASNAPLPCKFYPNCANINCQFAHPPRSCRYGVYCAKQDCAFDHTQVPPVDKLKWTRCSST